jgi:hypothetical protein
MSKVTFQIHQSDTSLQNVKILTSTAVLVVELLNVVRLPNYLASQSFDFESAWWRLLQKRVVHTKFYIYVLFT